MVDLPLSLNGDAPSTAVRTVRGPWGLPTRGGPVRGYSRRSPRPPIRSRQAGPEAARARSRPQRRKHR